MKANRRVRCARTGSFWLLLAGLLASLLAGCAHGNRSSELSVAELRVLVARYMNEDAARRATADDSRRHSYDAKDFRAMADYAALERFARESWNGKTAADFLEEMNGGDASPNRVYFMYERSLRNFPFVSVRRDGTGIRTAFLPWCR
jgi:hypothetical protein